MAPIKSSGSVGRTSSTPKTTTSAPKSAPDLRAKASASTATKSTFKNPLEKLVDLGTKPKPFAIDPGKLLEAVKQGVKDLSKAFGELQNIASQYDPELGARAGLEGVVHTGTTWLEQNVPLVGKPVSTLVDKLFNKPPPQAEWPSPPPPVSPNPPLDGDLSGSKWVSTDGVPLLGPDGAVSMPDDVKQGGLGDCYFMASMAGLTEQEASQLVNDNHDGTYTVRLYDVGSDGKVTPAFVTVTGELPEPSGAHYGGDRGKWAALVEKAYAAHLGSYDRAGGNNNPKFFAAPTVLTGRTTVAYALPVSDPGILYSQLEQSTAQGRPAFAGFYGSDHDGLIANHAYTVTGVRTDPATGQRYVELRNPWGSTEPGNDGTNDGVFELKLEDFMRSYQAVAVAGG